MKSKSFRLCSLAVLALSVALTSAHAQARRFSVTHDVSALGLSSSTNPTNLTYLSFQLADGDGSGNGNSKATISNLALSGGLFDSPLPNFGNVVVNGDGSVVLRDGIGAGNELADYSVGFRVTAGTAKLTYDVTIETTGIDEPAGDYFHVALLDNDLTTVETTGPTGWELVGLEIDRDPLKPAEGYDIDPLFAAPYTAAGDLRFQNLLAPVVTRAVVPEPATLAALGLGIAALARRRRRR